jgi:hypothetical protein
MSSTKRVRVGASYVFDPTRGAGIAVLDLDYVRYAGQTVTVAEVPGMPGQRLPVPWAHVKTSDGTVLMVNRASLTSVRNTRSPR